MKYETKFLCHKLTDLNLQMIKERVGIGSHICDVQGIPPGPVKSGVCRSDVAPLPKSRLAISSNDFTPHSRNNVG